MTRLRRAARRACAAVAALAAAAGLAALAGGVPWLMWHVAGWPLPRRLPTLAGLQAALAGPETPGDITRLLACAGWAAWAVLAAQAAAEAAWQLRHLTALAAARHPAAALRGRAASLPPGRALAALLIGGVLLGLLAAVRGAGTARAAPAAPPKPPPAAARALSGWHPEAPGPGLPASPYTVRPGDSLWGIAQERLGDGGAWHEIWDLNKGHRQPGGGSLTVPALIQPGWILRLPEPPGRRPAPPPAAGPSPAAPSPAARAGRHAPPAPVPRARARPADGRHGQGIPLPSGGLAGTALALAVTAALAAAALHRRRRYRPGRDIPVRLDPDPDLARPLPPVITALRRAAMPPDPPDPYGPVPGEDAMPGPAIPAPALPRAGPDEAAAPAAVTVPPGPGPRGAASASRPAPLPAPPAAPAGVTPLGVRDGREAAADIAALGGLGLDGPGAPAAARAILAGLLAQAPPARASVPAVIIPAADAARLLPGTGPAAVPGLAIPATLGAALGELEAIQLTLARLSAAGREDSGPAHAGPAPAAAGPGATLIAAAGHGGDRRLAGILDAGRRTGIAAVLLGAWPAGVTCQVAADGTVTAVTPPHPDLDRIRLFTLSAAETAAITAVLREAAGSPPPSLPAPPAAAPDQGQGSRTGNHTGGIRDPAGPEALPGPARVPGPAPGAPASAAEPEPGAAPPEAARPARLALLGPPRITVRGQEVSGGMRKARELLAFLAVHPDGASGEAISEALWPGSDPGRAAGQRNLALRKARELLRAAAGTPAHMWILNASGRYRLDPALISTDLQAFGEALEAARSDSAGARLAACRRAVALYRGELAEGAGYEWAGPYAETARRRALDAWTAIAEILQPADPGQALSALEAALGHDPYNEYLYVRIMRLQAAAGRPEAVRRTLALLESRLTELGITPGTQTRQAAASLLAAARPGPGGQQPGGGQNEQRTG